MVIDSGKIADCVKEMIDKDITVIKAGFIEYKGKKYEITAEVKEME